MSVRDTVLTLAKRKQLHVHLKAENVLPHGDVKPEPSREVCVAVEAIQEYHAFKQRLYCVAIAADFKNRQLFYARFLAYD